MPKIKRKDRDTIIQALRAGVVPNTGLNLIQVGRKNETAALINDLDRLCEGGALFRLIIGDYGSGKTFFLHLVKAIALKKKVVTMHADLTPTRRLNATGGQARALFAELAKSTSTMTKPDGGAIQNIIEKFISDCRMLSETSHVDIKSVIKEKLASLSELTNSYDFITVLLKYWDGFEQGNDEIKNNALRWIRGEYSTKTEARMALGVRNIIDDSSFYSQLKLFSRFVKIAGYKGLMIELDELVNLYKMANKQARNANYEEILHILNDCLQGNMENMGFLLGGTPEFLMDTNRGLYSYSALQSRLAENEFAQNGLVDFTHPVLRLSNLTPEDLLVLLEKLRNVFANGDKNNYLLPDEALVAFIEHCDNKIGDSYFRTPRTTITAFVNLLSVLEQNVGVDWHTLINKTDIAKDIPDQISVNTDDMKTECGTDEFANFKLN